MQPRELGSQQVIPTIDAFQNVQKIKQKHKGVRQKRVPAAGAANTIIGRIRSNKDKYYSARGSVWPCGCVALYN
jgi:hypothetical protein